MKKIATVLDFLENPDEMEEYFKQREKRNAVLLREFKERERIKRKKQKEKRAMSKAIGESIKVSVTRNGVTKTTHLGVTTVTIKDN